MTSASTALNEEVDEVEFEDSADSDEGDRNDEGEKSLDEIIDAYSE